MPDLGFAAFLARSLAILRREVAGAYQVMCSSLARHELVLCVSGEVVGMRFTRRRALLRPPERPTIAVRTTRGAILALIDAEATLLDAILDDRLELVGAPEEILAFYAGLMAYLHGAVRAPSFPSLLRAYRMTPAVEE